MQRVVPQTASLFVRPRDKELSEAPYLLPLLATARDPTDYGVVIHEPLGGVQRQMAVQKLLETQHVQPAKRISWRSTIDAVDPNAKKRNQNHAPRKLLTAYFFFSPFFLLSQSSQEKLELNSN